MSWEFAVILTDAPNIEGGFCELARTETDEFVGEHIDWDAGIVGYSGWNQYTAGVIGDETGDANYELLSGLGNQSYVKLSERQIALDRFEARLEDITNKFVRARCAALIAGCREALARDPDRAVLLVF